ncbi:MAG: CaiB/BaiF CoA-transferase family protein, partial [Thermodesulfobacteriota bacterium]|nr:CaiB/BaiF CoA-transferase family protein [Thermodesulfobacteriota bacterium]
YASPAGEENRKKAAYNSWHRNKKNMVLNLRSEEGREIFLKLSEKADVIIEGFRPGVVRRLGIDYETMSQLNNRIIYCSISGYGQDGPYRDLPGHDLNYISIGGLLGLIGKSDRQPAIPLNTGADWAGGALHSVIGILIALLARGNTGKGQYVDISMTDGVISYLGMLMSNFFFQGMTPKRDDNALCGSFPYYGVYKAKDGKYISIGCIEPWFWENLCKELGREDLMPYVCTPEHMLRKTDEADWDKVFSELQDIFMTKTSDEWVKLLASKNIPITKVYDVDETFSDPQVLHRKMLVEVDHPHVGKVKQVGIPIKLSETPGEIRGFSPLLGENTDETLQGLGYTAEKIDRLRKEGTIA